MVPSPTPGRPFVRLGLTAASQQRTRLASAARDPRAEPPQPTQRPRDPPRPRRLHRRQRVLKRGESEARGGELALEACQLAQAVGRGCLQSLHAAATVPSALEASLVGSRSGEFLAQAGVQLPLIDERGFDFRRRRGLRLSPGSAPASALFATAWLAFFAPSLLQNQKPRCPTIKLLPSRRPTEGRQNTASFARDHQAGAPLWTLSLNIARGRMGHRGRARLDRICSRR